MDHSMDESTGAVRPRTALEHLADVGGPLAAATYALLRDDGHPRFVEAATDGIVLVRSAVDRRAVILVDADRLVLQAVLPQWVAQAAGTGVEVVFLGDRPVDPGLARGLSKHWPTPPVVVYRVDSHGERHGIERMSKTPSPVARVLTAPSPTPTSEDWERVAHDRRDLARAAMAEMERLQAFAQSLRARKPIATWTLAIVIIAVFVLTLLVGGGTPLWALNRLGALDAASILAGDYFRLVSCTFLHGDVVHLGFNTFVLVALGTSLERIVGPWRFLAIYGVSGLVGSVVSAWRLSDGGISVGASGAIWGLMAAEVLLVLSPMSPLPLALRERARNGALANLALNVVNSFRPHVDFAAHFGGGVAGLVVAMLVFRGAVGTGGAMSAKASSTLRAFAVALVAVYLGGLGLAMARAEPWRFFGDGGSVAVTVAPLKVRAAIPAVIANELRDVSTDAGPEVTFGAVETSPVVVGLKVGHFDAPLAPETLDAEAAAAVEAIKNEPSDGPALDVTSERTQDIVTIAAVAELPNGLFYEKCYRFDTVDYVATESLFWPQAKSTWRGVARRVAESVEFGVSP
ncbi:MAG: rhomboid family intramembrane serine protease [Myxococcales bacterium]|nr:rhomboid family intramembrane serine protease [Myxococcales bacterium]